MATYGGELSRRPFATLEVAEPDGLRPALRGGAGVAALLAVALLLGGFASARAEASEVSRAAEWLESVQNGDGGFGTSPGAESAAEITCWAMLGLEAAGRNPLDVSRAGATPVDFLSSRVGQLESPGDLARTILALEGAGVDPREFGGQNLVARLLSRRRDNGSYEGWPNSTAYAVIALRAAGISGVDASLSWLRKVQNEDGGWGDVPGSPSNADSTGAVLQALSGDSKASGRGLSYLRNTQHIGGGFTTGGNGTLNTQSTSWAVQGITAAGGDPTSFRRGGSSALNYLTNNQLGNGSYRYAKPSATVSAEVANQTPVWVTGEVMVAASGAYLPISAPPRDPKASRARGATFGGISPSDVPGFESQPSAPPESTGGAPAPSIPPPASAGKGSAGAPPLAGLGNAKLPGGGKASPPSKTPASDPVSGTPVSSTEETSPAGAVVAGLLAGALLFAVVWVARRGWMRWRYGL
jgi:hypothetical protein